jgi:hypothetical protein
MLDPKLCMGVSEQRLHFYGVACREYEIHMTIGECPKHTHTQTHSCKTHIGDGGGASMTPSMVKHNAEGPGGITSTYS